MDSNTCMVLFNLFNHNSCGQSVAVVFEADVGTESLASSISESRHLPRAVQQIAKILPTDCHQIVSFEEVASYSQ